MCRESDSWRGVVPHCARVAEEQLEVASLVLRFGTTAEGEVGAQEQMKPLLLHVGAARGRGGDEDLWLCEQLWNGKDTDDHGRE